MEVPAQEGAPSGEEQEDGSAAALSLLLAASAPSPTAATPSPARPQRSQIRPAPKPTALFPTAAGGYSQPGKKLPRWLGVNRHLEQRTKGKESHKAGRLGSRGLVSLTPPPTRLQNASAAGTRVGRLGPSVPAQLAGPQLGPLARGEGAQKWQASPARSHPLCKVGGCTHTHTHTRARTPPARGRWSCPPPPPSPLQRPCRGPAPNLLPGRRAERRPLQPALELRR